jgi:hypothetical protein
MVVALDNCWTPKPEIVQRLKGGHLAKGFVRVCCTFATAQANSQPQPHTCRIAAYHNPGREELPVWLY